MARTRVLALISCGIGLLLPLLAAEAVLRLLPVRTGLRTLPVNPANPIRRFEPNRKFIFSRDWNFDGVNHGRTNNLGFINDQDYDSTARTPLLAVIGDSYVEAPMVPFPETIHGRLAACADGRGRVYSFGASGVPMSEYLGEADYARATFHPDAMVVIVVGNDFDRSLRKYAGTTGLHMFRQDSSGLVLQLLNYHPSTWRRLVRHSALARYIVLNLAGGVDAANQFLHGNRPRPRYVANVEAAASPEKVRDSRAVVDEFLKQLPARAGLPPGRIVILVDGIRPQLYDPDSLKTTGGLFIDVMRRYLLAQARTAGFDAIDLQEHFLRRYARDSTRFEFATDNHWNGVGHGVAAEAVVASPVFRETFPGACTALAPEAERVPHT